MGCSQVAERFWLLCWLLNTFGCSVGCWTRPVALLAAERVWLLYFPLNALAALFSFGCCVLPALDCHFLALISQQDSSI
jgi:hypothetical protein